MADFFKKAFHDMKESAKAQHEVDKANFAAVKAESKATWLRRPSFLELASLSMVQVR